MAQDARAISVTIGDDRDVRRAELRWALQSMGAQVVAEAVTGADLLRLSFRHQPDVVVTGRAVAAGPPSDLIARLLAGVPGSQLVCDEPVMRPPRSGDRLHVVRGLVPRHVALTVRSLTYVAPAPAARAVVCIADPMFRLAVIAALGDERIATVEEVRGAAEAYRAVGDLRPDFLIMDLSLTGIGGWLYLMELAEEHPDCRVIVTSPLGAAPIAVLEVGAAAVVAEGDVAGLRSAVRSVLGERQGPLSDVPVSGEDASSGNRMVNPPSS